MSIFFEHNTGRWIADNYSEAYDKACETDDSVWWGDHTSGNHIINLQRVKRPQAPNVVIRNGKLHHKEMPDI